MLDKQPPESMVRILDIAKGGEGNVFEPTLRLRQVTAGMVNGPYVQGVGPTIYKPVVRVQQLWVDKKTGAGEWRDIEEVVETPTRKIPNPCPM